MTKLFRITVRLSEQESDMVDELKDYIKDTYKIDVSAAEVLRIALKEYNDSKGGR